MSGETHEDYKTIVRDAVMDEAAFQRLTLSKRQRADETQWVKIVVRPVLIKGRRKLQFSYFDPRKNIVKNYGPEEVLARLDEALRIPFAAIQVQSTTGDAHIRITRKGEALIGRSKPSQPEKETLQPHDRAKAYALPAEPSDEFLQVVGITDKQGRVRPGMQGKFRQINEFLRLLQQVVPKADEGATTHIVDCGCGNAYLTFAAYHYLTAKRGMSVEVTGIDTNQELIDSSQALRDQLGWSGLGFHNSSIAEFAPEQPPDIVLSLHACDTATDEAIAQGIIWESKAILAAPCCQHELHTQLSASTFRPILRHGILKERLGDILTDAFRALVLRIMGYRAEVVQFVDPEHTAKNLMIRAEAGLKPGDAASVREYKELKDFWSVEPVIEEMLGDRIRQYL